MRSGFVTMIGRPNVGKSTLMNRLVGQKIAITSNKPQTTRGRIRTVFTDENKGQIVFVDTPGIHKSKNRLGESMQKVASDAIADVDVIMWLVEPVPAVGRGEMHIAGILKEVNKPVILIINKTDSVKKDDILPVIAAYKDIMDFSEIVPLSAREGDGVDELYDIIFSYLPEGPMFFDADTLTDQPLKQIVAEIVREKALHALSDEVPHGIAVLTDSMKQRTGNKGSIWDIDATIICERESHKGIIIGKGGAMIGKIGTNARFEIEKLMESHVNLKLHVKVKKDWRDSDYLVSNYVSALCDFK